MKISIKYNYKEKSKYATKHHFILTQRIDAFEYYIYFHTFEDSSGFGIDVPIMSDPYDFVALGIAIIAERKFIIDEVEKHLRD